MVCVGICLLFVCLTYWFCLLCVCGDLFVPCGTLVSLFVCVTLCALCWVLLCRDEIAELPCVWCSSYWFVGTVNSYIYIHSIPTGGSGYSFARSLAQPPDAIAIYFLNPFLR